jgi:acetyl esterase/lipase
VKITRSIKIAKIVFIFFGIIALLLCLTSAVVLCCVPLHPKKTQVGNWLFLLSVASDFTLTKKQVDIAYGVLPRQRLDVYLPKEKPKGVVVFGYGGGFLDGNKDEYGFVGEAFTSLGYLTVIYDYRLNSEVTFPTYLQDAALAVRWAFDHAKDFHAPQKIIIAGHSAGAYLAAMLSSNKSYLNQVQLSPKDIFLTICFSGGFEFFNPKQKANGGFATAEFQQVFGSPKTYQETQPIQYVDGDEPPFLIVHGVQDQVLSVQQARKFVARLISKKRPVGFLEYPELDHAKTITTFAKPLRSLSTVFADTKIHLEQKNP